MMFEELQVRIDKLVGVQDARQEDDLVNWPLREPGSCGVSMMTTILTKSCQLRGDKDICAREGLWTLLHVNV